ncbi:MAG: TrmB family transcriptional regulator [Methanoregula sp.]|nr:MAG: TrmB family transcriptional regulator [Methanoregula sp.]
MVEPADETVRIANFLKSLGLTKYEALVYIALLRMNDATATGIHEISGVPRASVYPVLDQLKEKALVSVSQSSPKRFAALPPEEGIRNLLSRIEQDAAHAKTALETIHRERLNTERAEQELIWNVYGISAVQKKLVELLSHARHRVRLMAHPRILSEDVKKVLFQKARQATIEIVTHEWDGGIVSGMTVYEKKLPEIPKEFDRAKDLMAGGIFIIDDHMVMVVMGSGDEDAVALYSGSVGFLRFFIRYYNFIIEWAKNTGR